MGIQETTLAVDHASAGVNEIEANLPSSPKAPPDRAGWNTKDLVICLALGVGACFASLYGASKIPPIIVSQSAMDSWFEADSPRVFSDMSYRFNVHTHTNAHPLFTLVMWPIVNALRNTFGIDSLSATRILIAQTAGLWIVAFFALLRLVGCRRLDAAMLSALAGVSAGAMFWFVVPETFPFGSFSIVLALAMIAISHRRKHREAWYVVASAITLSMVLTNWMVGIIATFANYPWRRAVQISINAFCLVVVLWVVQLQFFPLKDFFLVFWNGEQKFMVSPAAGGQLGALTSFFFHSIIMPSFADVDRWIEPGRELMLTQQSLPGSGTAWGSIAAVLWAIILIIGLLGFFSHRQSQRLTTVLGLALLGQVLLHLFYGWETFLYSAHFVPLLVTMAAFATFTSARRWALGLVMALVICAAINNVIQFNHAVGFYQRHSLSHSSVTRSISGQ
jgi:hypothetical protein